MPRARDTPGQPPWGGIITLPRRLFARSHVRLFATLVGVLALIWSAACGVEDSSPTVADDAPQGASGACAEDRTLHFGFYTLYEPVSYNADPNPDSPGFSEHLGYEADLLTALQAMEGAGLRFERKPIAEWPDIWLRAAGPDLDIVGGGITIRPARTFNSAGDKVVEFTSGHILFRQSLLVRSEDADLYPTHRHLTSDVRVGVAPATTGEGRLLLLTGLRDSDGRLAAGTRVVTESGTLVADGSDRFVITPAGSTPNLESRQLLEPPSSDMPVVVYLEDGTSEAAMQEAVRNGLIDAYANEEIGNLEAVHAQENEGGFAVTAYDTEAELGGWALPADQPELIACLDDKINHLTDHRRIGVAEWRVDPDVFLRRAEAWIP